MARTNSGRTYAERGLVDLENVEASEKEEHVEQATCYYLGLDYRITLERPSMLRERLELRRLIALQLYAVGASEADIETMLGFPKRGLRLVLGLESKKKK